MLNSNLKLVFICFYLFLGTQLNFSYFFSVFRLIEKCLKKFNHMGGFENEDSDEELEETEAVGVS